MEANFFKISNTIRNIFDIEVSENPSEPHKVHNYLYSKSLYSQLPDPKLLLMSQQTLFLLDINSAIPFNEDCELFQIISGKNLFLYDILPLSHNYSGYQYGTYVGQLGDGRSLSLGDIINKNFEKWEINLKGTGKTAYSRTADGRSMLRSCIKEFLFSEYMNIIGGPTTRCLCVLGSFKELVERDLIFEGDREFEPAGILCRVSPNFIRFGSFELLLEERLFQGEGWDSKKKVENLLKQLMDYVIQYDFKHISHQDADKYEKFYEEVVKRTAKMVAFWQAYGFCHGTLNTDNMSILGLTLDYETSGFMEIYDPKYNPNSSMDIGGRYNFEEQPKIIAWNLMKLAEDLKNVSNYEKNTQCLKSEYAPLYVKEYESKMFEKMGIFTKIENDWKLIYNFLELLQKYKADYTKSFRWLSCLESPYDDIKNIECIQEFCQEKVDQNIWADFLKQYEKRIKEQQLSEKEIKEKMKKINPKFVLRSQELKKAMESIIIEEGNMNEINSLYKQINEAFIYE